VEPQLAQGCGCGDLSEQQGGDYLELGVAVGVRRHMRVLEIHLQWERALCHVLARYLPPHSNPTKVNLGSLNAGVA
jgi:hypothetical protein